MQFADDGSISLSIEGVTLRQARFETLPAPEEAPGATTETKAQISSETLDDDGEECAVVLAVQVDRTVGEHKVFHCEVRYAGAFAIRGGDRAARHRLLLTRCLDILYPYAGAAVAHLAGQAGFRDVHLAPINFADLYRSKQREQEQWEHLQDKVVRH